MQAKLRGMMRQKEERKEGGEQKEENEFISDFFPLSNRL